MASTRKSQKKILKNKLNNKKPFPKCTKRYIYVPLHTWKNEFSSIWEEMRIKKQLCDGIVKCEDGIEFPIHRAILAAVSPYFRALFTNTLQKEESDIKEANVNVRSSIFKTLLHYIYTGQCIINKSNVANLLKFADQYQILGAVDLCCEFLKQEMCPTNCLSIFQLANQYFCKELIENTYDFIKCNFIQVLNNCNEFIHLNVNDLLKLLNDDELNVKREYLVFEAIHKWMSFSSDERNIYLFDLVKCLRLGRLSNENIHKIINWVQYQENLESKIYIDNFLQNVNKMDDNMIIDPTIKKMFKLRIPHDLLFAIGGWSLGSPTNLIETYDPRSDRWLLFSNIRNLTCRAYHGLCTLKGLIYLIGGFDGNEYFNTVQQFNPIIKKWRNCTSMNYHRCYISVASYQNNIYVMGGFNGRRRLDTVEVYDCENNEWNILAPMQTARSDASAATLNNKIYIVGGFNGDEIMRSCEMFNIKTNQWTYSCSMNSVRSGVSLIAFDNTLYALGGYDGRERLTICEKYVPESDMFSWTNITSMFRSRSNFASVILDDFIYVIGGFDGTATINSVEYYDPETNEWSEASSMNKSRSALSACVINGLKNIKEYIMLEERPEEIQL